MEEVCDRENLVRAWKRVRRNKGSPGVDGMTIDDAGDHLREHWPSIRSQLLEGAYQPQPVKRVEIPILTEIRAVSMAYLRLPRGFHR